MDEYKQIRSFHTGPLLQITDWFTIIPGLEILAKKTADSVRLDINAPKADLKNGAMFISNHRDIIMDAAWLSLLLREKMNIRPFMGIGNNLFGKWWIEPFLRFNRGFAVMRGGSPRELMQNSETLSGYIHYLRSRRKSVWLAQREGRAKDGDDRTQPAVLKMLTLYSDTADGGRKNNLLDNIRALNICPVSISYEYDPCDYLKAREMQLKRDNPEWKKAKEDDLESMSVGIHGQKGRVVYRITSSINHWIEKEEAQLKTMNRNEQIQAIAAQIDRQIHSAYEIFPRDEAFDRYIESRIDLINLPDKDIPFLRERLHEMYANPVINHEKSLRHE